MPSTDWIGKWGTYTPEKVAVKQLETGVQITYRKLHELSNRLIHWFSWEFGLSPGDRLVILSENRVEHLILFSAAQKAGWILVPVNHRLAAHEVAAILRLARPRRILAEAPFHPLIPANQQTLIQSMEDLLDGLPWEETSHLPATVLSLDDPIFILFTSGTTGLPKGVMYTHRMLLWNSINTSLALTVNADSRILNVMPLFHTGGWNVLVTPVLHHGGTVLLSKRFDPEKALQWLAEEHITLFMGVPTMLRMLTEQDRFETTDLRSLLYLIVGGEPMPVPLIQKWHAHQVLVRQGYGMTEAGPNLTSLHHSDAIRKAGSIGKPNFYVRIRIVDEQGNDVSPGDAGELWIQGPMVTPGFWEQPEMARDTFTEGWLRTGDLVRQDEEGDLFVVDRIKNMYISGGENVYPAEVERVLRGHPEVVDVAVIGVPDPQWGETGKAYLVVKDAHLRDAGSIRDYCKERLAKFKIPRHFAFVDHLPLNDAGKVDRKKLKKL
ncbi:MAG: long-chain fatty acid--CoA ligase [Saprospiraceae bacterium]|nr:long-chain fatty acid--CoA ligase [Saprospiraceae bacterium]